MIDEVDKMILFICEVTYPIPAMMTSFPIKSKKLTT